MGGPAGAPTFPGECYLIALFLGQSCPLRLCAPSGARSGVPFCGLELPFPLGRRARSSAGLKRGFACLRDLDRCVREGERETLSTEDVDRRGSFCTGALSP